MDEEAEEEWDGDEANKEERPNSAKGLEAFSEEPNIEEDDGEADGDEDNIANGPKRFFNSDRLNPSPIELILPKVVVFLERLNRSLKPVRELSLLKKGEKVGRDKMSPLQRLDNN